MAAGLRRSPIAFAAEFGSETPADRRIARSRRAGVERAGGGCRYVSPARAGRRAVVRESAQAIQTPVRLNGPAPRAGEPVERRRSSNDPRGATTSRPHRDRSAELPYNGPGPNGPSGRLVRTSQKAEPCLRRRERQQDVQDGGRERSQGSYSYRYGYRRSDFPQLRDCLAQPSASVCPVLSGGGARSRLSKVVRSAHALSAAIFSSARPCGLAGTLDGRGPTGPGLRPGEKVRLLKSRPVKRADHRGTDGAPRSAACVLAL